MKTIILAMLMAIPFTMQAQDGDKSYTMFSTLYLSPDRGQIEEFRAGIKAHKEKFHPADGPFAAAIFRVNNGPRAGDYVWLEGPQTFSDYDKDLGEGHGPDWGKNIDPHLSDYGLTEYWKRLDDHTRTGSTRRLRQMYLQWNSSRTLLLTWSTSNLQE